MLRTSLFLMLTSMAGVVAAQTQDPLAAAPVQYDDGPAPQQAAQNVDSQQSSYNTVMDCGMDNQGRPQACPNDEVGYTPDDEMGSADDAPLFAPDYYAYDDYAYYPSYPYFAGVSLWPSYYWPGYAWGWGGWGLGWGWPSISIGFGWGWHGGWHHGYAWHGGWHGGDHFHGPWHYDGHGHYADNHGSFGRGGSFAGRAGVTSRNFAANRGFSGERGFGAAQGARSFNGTQNRAFGANREGVNGFNGANRFGANRSPLPSASYYSGARGSNSAQSFNRGNFQSANRAQFGNDVVRGGSAVGNRQFSATNRGQSFNGNRAFSSSMQGQRSGAMSNRSFQPTQRNYAGYSGARGGSYGGRPSYAGHPSYSGGRGGYSGGHSSSHASAPSHSSGGGGGGEHGGGGSRGGDHHR